MSKTDIQLEGLDDIIKRLESAEDIKALEAGIKKACLRLEAEAKKNAQANGNKRIAQSITTEVNGTEGVVFTPLFYAPYVEFGTGKFAEGGKGRKEIPWVYVEDNSSSESNTSKKTYTEEEANKAVAYLRSKGLNAFKTEGQHPKPFLRPALYNNKEKCLKDIKESVWGKND